MKYKIVVQKEKDIDQSEERMLRGRYDNHFDDVFGVEINADEAIELAQHLWDIHQRKYKKQS